MTAPDGPLVRGLAAVLVGVKALRDPVERARAADEAAEVLRAFEAMFCATRDEAIRDDRRARPERTVAELAELTRIGPSTIVNARRVSRPVRYRLPAWVTERRRIRVTDD